MATTKLYANKNGERAQVAFMRIGTANGSDKVVRIQRGMQVLYDDWPQCTISANAEHTTGIAPATLRYGQPWAAALIPDSGYGIDSVEVLMDGTDITQEAYQDGIISIPRVTGNVVITVETASQVNTNMFTRRTTADGVVLGNDKAVLEGVRGNTMMFYQRLYNPDFSNGQTNWIGRTGYTWVITVEDGILRIKAPSNCQPYLVQETIFTEAHTYLCIARVRITDGVAGKALNFRNASNTYQAAKLAELNTWYTVSRVITFDTVPTSVGNRWFGILYDYLGATMEVDWAQCIDLTRLRGNDTSIVTSYSSFHKLFPLDVYNQGQVIIDNSMIDYISKDVDGELLQNVHLDIRQLTVNDGNYKREFKITPTTGKYYATQNAIVGSVWGYAQTTDANAACIARTVYAGEVYHIYGYSSVSTAYKQYTLLDRNKVVLYKHNPGEVNSRTNPTIVTIEEDGIMIVNFQSYNAEKDKCEAIYTTLFPTGIRSAYDEEGNLIYDEIKQDGGIWKAYRRIGDTRLNNNISGRAEFEVLEEEEVYILDDQTIPTEITVADQGTEEILPTNEATPTTAPAIMEIQYGAIPSRGLLGGLLGGTKGGGSDEPDYSDGEEIIDYEEEKEPNEDSDEPIVEEPLEEPSDEEPKEEETEEEPIEDIKESPVIDEKQELKK